MIGCALKIEGLSDGKHFGCPSSCHSLNWYECVMNQGKPLVLFFDVTDRGWWSWYWLSKIIMSWCLQLIKSQDIKNLLVYFGDAARIGKLCYEFIRPIFLRWSDCCLAHLELGSPPCAQSRQRGHGLDESGQASMAETGWSVHVSFSRFDHRVGDPVAMDSDLLIWFRLSWSSNHCIWLVGFYVTILNCYLNVINGSEWNLVRDNTAHFR